MKILQFIFYIAIYILFSINFSHASEVHIEGNRVIIKTDNGKVIDTANLPNTSKIKQNNIEINDKEISIGSVTNKNGKQEGVHRSTKLENVTIINNGHAEKYSSTANESPNKEK